MTSLLQNPAKRAGLIYLIMTILVFIGSLRLIIIPGETITPLLILIARMGIVTELIHIMLFLVLAWALYVLFSPVNRNLALVVLLSISVSVAIQALNTLNWFAAFSLLTGADYMQVFEAEQVLALAEFYLELHMDTTHIVEFFWFLWLFAAGLLVYRSGILPEKLGILLMIGGFGYLFVLLVFFMLPNFMAISIVGAVPAGLAELSLMVWLVVKGANVPESEVDSQ